MIYIIFPLRMKHTWKNLDISLSTTNMNPPVTGALSNKVKLKWKKRRRVFWLDVWTKLTSSRRLRSVQDANQWVTSVSNPWKMPEPAFCCRLPSAASDFGSAMTSNYVMTRKVPQTDSTDPHTLTSWGRILPYRPDLHSWRVVKTWGKYAASSLSSPPPLPFQLRKCHISLNWPQAEASDFAEPAWGGMMEEMRREQRAAAGQNNLTRVAFLQCVACSAFSCLGGHCSRI